MLSVILTILKILGIVVGAIVALVLLIAFALLFVPIRYKIKADGKAPDFKGSAKASWLLSLASAKAEFDGDLKAKVRVLFFTLKDFKKEFPKDDEKDDRDIVTKILDKVLPYKKAAAEDDAGSADLKISEDDSYADDLPDISEMSADESVVEAEAVNEPAENETQTKSQTMAGKSSKDILDEIVIKAQNEKEEPPKPKLTIKERIGRLYKKIKNKIKSILRSIKEAIAKALEKLRKAQDKYEEITNFIDDRRNREAFNLIKTELLSLLKHMRPRKLVGNLRLGLDDPATTGRILGVYYMLCSSLYKHFTFTGEFEEEVIEGNIYIKGHIRLIHVLISFIKLYRNKRIKKWLKKK